MELDVGSMIKSDTHKWTAVRGKEREAGINVCKSPAPWTKQLCLPGSQSQAVLSLWGAQGGQATQPPQVLLLCCHGTWRPSRWWRGGPPPPTLLNHTTNRIVLH